MHLSGVGIGKIDTKVHQNRVFEMAVVTAKGLRMQGFSGFSRGGQRMDPSV